MKIIELYLSKTRINQNIPIVKNDYKYLIAPASEMLELYSTSHAMQFKKYQNLKENNLKIIQDC